MVLGPTHRHDMTDVVGGGVGRTLWFTAVLLALTLSTVSSVKQRVSLSDSYLPVAMQVIAHLTDQMTFDEAAKTTNKPSATSKPTTASRPGAPLDDPGFPSGTTAGSLETTTRKLLELTTPYHKPGFFAPVAPPQPGDRVVKGQSQEFLLPMSDHDPYRVMEPSERVTREPLLSMHQDDITPILEPKPEREHLLPPSFEDKLSRTEDVEEDEWSDENLQYLSPSVRELVTMARDPQDRLIEVFRKGDDKLAQGTRGKLSASNLRLMLLYDLLSRDAKKQRLSDYSGFSASVLRDLVETSSGSARAQLSRALSRMVERGDCTHEYANNRAREMVVELAKDSSLLSAEVNNLQPLHYSY